MLQRIAQSIAQRFQAVLLLSCLLISACTPSNDEQALVNTQPIATESQQVDLAQQIVDKAIEAHGSKMLDNAVIEFDYRGKHFKATRNNGMFSYERTYADSTGDVREVLNNDEAYREVNGARVEITEKKRYSIQETNNSVIYFGFVPYFLNDPAVQKQHIGQTIVAGQPYHKIEITFRQEDGGPDFEDRFIYWFHAENYTMDYLAYDYHINDGGSRFREAFNVRTIQGVRVADFNNYKSELFPQPGTPIENYDTILGSEDLKLLSKIELENVTITFLESGSPES